MKAWFCVRCQRVLFGTPEHACVLLSFECPASLPPDGEIKQPQVGVPHILSVRKWCES